MLKYFVLLLVIGSISCNFFSQNKKTTSAIPNQKDKSIETNSRITIFTTDYFALLPGLLANGGEETTPNSLMSKLNISLYIQKISNDHQAFQALNDNKANIICVPAHSFTKYRIQYSNILPTSFFLTSWSRGDLVCLTKKQYRTIKEMNRKKVSCIKNSPEHYMLRFLLQANNISEKNIVWNFVKTGQEALKLLKQKNVDFSLVNISNNSISIPEGTYVLFSTEDFPKLIPFIFVARENYLLQNQTTIISFLKMLLEGRSYMAKLYKSDKKQLQQELRFLSLNKEKIISSYNFKKYATYNDNQKFFRLTRTTSIDHMFLYNTYIKFENITAWSKVALASQTIHTIPLLKLYKTFRRKKNIYIKHISGLPYFSSRKLIPFTISIPFKKDKDDLAIEEDTLLKYYSVLAKSLKNVTISIYPLKKITQEKEQIYLNKARTLYEVLTQRYKISRNKIILNRNIKGEIADNFKSGMISPSEDEAIILEFSTKH